MLLKMSHVYRSSTTGSDLVPANFQGDCVSRIPKKTPASQNLFVLYVSSLFRICQSWLDYNLSNVHFVYSLP